jgi:PST family polysaccharide transporter
MLVLARLLPPADFGLFGMAAVAVNFVMQFKDLGTGSALIHRERLDDELTSTVFWGTLAFAVLALGVGLLSAPLLAIVFRDGRVVAVLAVAMSGILFAAPGAVFQALVERAMRFREAALVEMGASAVAAVVALAMAGTGWGVWALVELSLTTSVLTAFGMGAACRWRPRWIFRWSALRSVAGYSGNVVGFSFVNYWVRNADNVLVGRYLGSAVLGYYSLAYRVMLYPLQNISSVVARVAFPAMSRMRGDVVRAGSAYLKMIRLVALVAFPLMGVVMGVAGPLTVTVFGERWAPVAPILMWLAPVGMVQSVGATVGVVFQSFGRPDIPLRWSLWTTPAVLGAFIVGLRGGATGVAAAYCVVSIVLFPISMLLALRLMDMSVGHLVRAVGPALLCACGAGAAAHVGAAWVAAWVSTGSASLVAGVLAGGLVYVSLAVLLLRRSLREAAEIVRQAVNRQAVSGA